MDKKIVVLIGGCMNYSTISSNLEEEGIDVTAMRLEDLYKEYTCTLYDDFQCIEMHETKEQKIDKRPYYRKFEKRKRF